MSLLFLIAQNKFSYYWMQILQVLKIGTRGKPLSSTTFKILKYILKFYEHFLVAELLQRLVRPRWICGISRTFTHAYARGRPHTQVSTFLKFCPQLSLYGGPVKIYIRPPKRVLWFLQFFYHHLGFELFFKFQHIGF